MPLFDEKSNRIIRRRMKRWKSRHNRFVKISRLIPFTAKQISNHWRNYLDPQLCHGPLSEDEKNFIIEQAQRYETIIRWKYILNNLEIKFGKCHSENKVKNYWNTTPLGKARKAKKAKKVEHKQEAGTEEQKQEVRTEVQKQEVKTEEYNQEVGTEARTDEQEKENNHFSSGSSTRIPISSLLNI